MITFLQFPLAKDKNIFIYYVFSFFFWIYPIIPVIAIFLQSKGFTYSEIGWILFVFTFSSIISEIPTSYLGDKYGRRNSILLGLVIIAIVSGIWGFGTTLLQYLVMSAIWMVGLSCLSGTFEAYIYDYLKRKNLLESYDGVISKSTMLTFVAFALGSIIGMYVYSINRAIPYLLVSAISCISLVLVLFMEDDAVALRNVKAEVKLEFVAGIKHILKSKSLIWITLFLSIFYCYDHYFINGANVPYLVSLNILNLEQIGFFIAGMSILQAVFANYFEKIRNRLSDNQIIIFLVLLQSCALFAMSFVFGFVGLIAFICFSMIEPFEPLLINSFSQKLIESKIRATTTSTIKLSISLFSSVLGVLCGYFTDYFSLKLSFLMVAILLSISFTVLLVVKWVQRINV
jgi:MFS family permease